MHPQAASLLLPSEAADTHQHDQQQEQQQPTAAATDPEASLHEEHLAQQQHPQEADHLPQAQPSSQLPQQLQLQGWEQQGLRVDREVLGQVLAHPRFVMLLLGLRWKSFFCFSKVTNSPNTVLALSLYRPWLLPHGDASCACTCSAASFAQVASLLLRSCLRHALPASSHLITGSLQAPLTKQGLCQALPISWPASERLMHLAPRAISPWVGGWLGAEHLVV